MRPTLGRAPVLQGGQARGPVERVGPRISGEDAEPLRGSFPEGLDGIASRLDARGASQYREPGCVI